MFLLSRSLSPKAELLPLLAATNSLTPTHENLSLAFVRCKLGNEAWAVAVTMGKNEME
jgi:hypothetical protein